MTDDKEPRDAAVTPEVDSSIAPSVAIPAAPASDGASTTGLPQPSRRAFERGVLLVIALILSCMFLHFARPVLVPIASAWVLAAALKPTVRFLQRMHLPAPIGAALVLFVVGTLGAFAAVSIGGDLDRWIAAAPEHLANARSRLEPLLEPL